MDKKTKLWLGVGIVGVGAYLLWNSKKKATPALATPAAPANLVGFDTGKFYDVKGGHAGVKGEGVFKDTSANKASMVGKVGPVTKSFANQPFNFAGSGVVGERKVAFSDAMGDRQVSADGVGGKFFEPDTKRFSRATRRRTTPVESDMPVPMRQSKPVNNFASAQGAGMINSFNVKGGF